MKQKNTNFLLLGLCIGLLIGSVWNRFLDKSMLMRDSNAKAWIYYTVECHNKTVSIMKKLCN